VSDIAPQKRRYGIGQDAKMSPPDVMFGGVFLYGTNLAAVFQGGKTNLKEQNLAEKSDIL
jgi:hypothetical protein